MGHPSVSLIICTYNRSSSLKTVLASLAQMNHPASFRWELIVVDNNSKDDTAGVVRAFAESSSFDVRYVFEAVQGLSHARNRGIQEAKGEIIVFTDDDVLVAKSWLTQLVGAFAGSDSIAAGGKTVALWNGPKPGWFYDGQPYGLEGVFVHFDLGDQPFKTTKPPFGANMAFRKSAFLNYGMFRTDLGRCGSVLGSGEETEFFRRLMSGNESVEYVPSALVYHPIPPERLRKSYVQSVFFQAGKSEFLVSTPPTSAVLYFGIPRYLLRMISQGLFAWFFSFQSKERFRNKLRVFHAAGMIAQSLNTSRSKSLLLPHVHGS